EQLAEGERQIENLQHSISRNEVDLRQKEHQMSDARDRVDDGNRDLNEQNELMYDIPTYYPHTAQKKYLLRRSYCHRGMFHSQEVIEYINERLKATWSPEQIACTPCELKMPSWRTIYRWLYEKYLVNGNLKVLRRKGKSHGNKETRGKYS